MDDATRKALMARWQLIPNSSRYSVASEADLCDFEAKYGPIPLVYRRFLAEFGGGVVGPQWVDGIAELAASHDTFRKTIGPQGGWFLDDVFLIGWDSHGQPLGIVGASGKVVVEDHEFGEVQPVADSFEAFLVARLLHGDV